jgi:uncharacterized membrane protein
VLGVAGFVAFGPEGLAALFAPFVVATLLGKLPGGFDEGPRNLRRVGANGLPALVGAVTALLGRPDLGAAFFVGGLACLGADTCATEIGVRYGGTPRTLLGRAIAQGESGGVTAAGLLASLGGALLAPTAYLAVAGFDVRAWGWLTAAGVAGALADSLLGSTLQFKGTDAATGRPTESTAGVRRAGARWMDNDAVNLVAGLCAAALAAGFLGAAP